MLRNSEQYYRAYEIDNTNSITKCYVLRPTPIEIREFYLRKSEQNV